MGGFSGWALGHGFLFAKLTRTNASIDWNNADKSDAVTEPGSWRGRREREAVAPGGKPGEPGAPGWLPMEAPSLSDEGGGGAAGWKANNVQ